MASHGYLLSDESTTGIFPVVLSTTSGINGLATGVTNLFTVPAGKQAIIRGASIRLTTVVALSGTIRLGIGIAAGEDDIFPATNLTGFNTTSETWAFNASGNSILGNAASVIKLGIDIAYGGTTATLAVDLIGYLI